MKLRFSLKSKEASLEADVEKLIEKRMDQRAKNPERKTRYQIKQEEKRKMKELEHKQSLQKTYIYISVMATLFAVLLVMAILETQGII